MKSVQPRHQQFRPFIVFRRFPIPFDVEPSLVKGQRAPFDGLPAIVEMLQRFGEQLQLRLTTGQVPTCPGGSGRTHGRIRFGGIFVQDLMQPTGILESDLQEFEHLGEVL